MNLTKSNFQTHLYFIFLIAIHYLVPFIFVGQVIVEPHDNLDNAVVYDHIISYIYKGDLEKLNYFLSGEIKWYYLEKLFYPINILHYVLDDKLFYFTNDILKKLFPYFSFFLLAKSLGIARFSAALGGILYSSLVYIKMPVGLGMAFLPYILYLLINKERLNKKHIFFLFLIGLNSSLIQDIFSFALLIPLSLLLKNKNFNFILYLKVFSIIFTASMLSNVHLIIGSIVSSTIHREAWDITNMISSPFLDVIKEFILVANYKDPLLIFYIPLSCLTLSLLILPFFTKNKNIIYLIIFIILVLILKSFMHHYFLDHILIGVFDILKGFNFQRVDRIIPLAYVLLLILYISTIKKEKLKKYLYFISFLSIICIQLKTPLPVMSKYFVQKNIISEKFIEAKKSFAEKNYSQVFKIIVNKKNYSKNNISFNSSTIKTFDNYYNFKNYSYIKSIVKNSRVLSVGFNPMVAIMNDIRTIDGYHNIYPLSYKIKFRKIIELELEKNIMLKNYYDNWGSRVYAFYTDKNNILLNFKEAKKLNADFVISKFPIKNKDLEIVCGKCNNSNSFYLYKIL